MLPRCKIGLLENGQLLDWYKRMERYMNAQRNVLFKIALICSLLLYSSQVWAGDEPGKWDAAGKEISEAAKAVGSASSESWRKTKEKTAETIGSAKEKGTQAWEKTKEKSSEVAKKTVDVSENIAEGTAEKSKGFWQKTKEKSLEWLEQVKAGIHKMTADDPQK